MLRSFDTCLNMVSADQYYVTYRGLKFTGHRGHVFFADQVLVFDWIAGSCQVNLLKTRQDWSEAG